MAISTSSYFSNALRGVPELGADVDIYEVSSNPKFAIGTGFERQDGNKYRYCNFGLLSNVGNVVAPEMTEISLTSTNLGVGAEPANVIRKSGELFLPNNSGARYMQLTITATADQFAGGYLSTIAGSGTGYTYRIKGNTATGNPVTGDCYLDLYDPIDKSVGSNTSIILAGSQYHDLSPAIGITSGAALGCVAGVTVQGMSAGNFGWACTRGITNVVLGTPTGSPGNLVCVSTNTAGAAVAVPITSGNNYYVIGAFYGQPYSATTYGLVKLAIE